MLELFTALRRFCGENAVLFGTSADRPGGCGYLESHRGSSGAAGKKKTNLTPPRLQPSLLSVRSGAEKRRDLVAASRLFLFHDKDLRPLDPRVRRHGDIASLPIARQASVDNFGLMPEFSTELSFDSLQKIWESTFRHKDIHCSIVGHPKDSPLKTTACKTLTKQCLSYEQSYPVFVGETPLLQAACEQLGTRPLRAVCRRRTVSRARTLERGGPGMAGKWPWWGGRFLRRHRSNGSAGARCDERTSL